MVSGLTAVQRGWRRLPDDVRTGPLAGLGHRQPKSRAKPAVWYLCPEFGLATPEFTLTDLYSATKDIDQVFLDVGDTRVRASELIESRIPASADRLRRLAAFLATLQSELKARDYYGADDRTYRQGIVEFFKAGERSSQDKLGTLAESVASRLTQTVELTPAGLAKTFDDPDTYAALDARLDLAWSTRPTRRPDEAVAKEYNDALESYLSGTGFEGAVPQMDSYAATRAWELAVQLDAPRGLLEQPVWFGLAATLPLEKPLLRGGLSEDGTPDAKRPPLEQSVYRRLWSLLKGALNQPWQSELAPLTELPHLEVTAATSPLGLRTPAARAALAAGAQLYLALEAEEPTVTHLNAPGAIGQANRMLARLVVSAGGLQKFSAIARDRLADPVPRLSVELWKNLHNAEYRSGLTLSPADAWGRIAGEVESFIRNIKGQFKNNRFGGVAASDLGESTIPSGETTSVATTQTLEDSLPQVVERVQTTLRHLSFTQGPELFLEFLVTLQRFARGGDDASGVRPLWEQAGAEIARGESPVTIGVDGVEIPVDPSLAASWEDLLIYLDTQLASDDE